MLSQTEVTGWFRPDYYGLSKATLVLSGFCILHAPLILMFCSNVKALHVASENQIQLNCSEIVTVLRILAIKSTANITAGSVGFMTTSKQSKWYECNTSGSTENICTRIIYISYTHIYVYYLCFWESKKNFNLPNYSNEWILWLLLIVTVYPVHWETGVFILFLDVHPNYT